MKNVFACTTKKQLDVQNSMEAVTGMKQPKNVLHVKRGGLERLVIKLPNAIVQMITKNLVCIAKMLHHGMGNFANFTNLTANLVERILKNLANVSLYSMVRTVCLADVTTLQDVKALIATVRVMLRANIIVNVILDGMEIFATILVSKHACMEIVKNNMMELPENMKDVFVFKKNILVILNH
jgi:hypothetical protein